MVSSYLKGLFTEFTRSPGILLQPQNKVCFKRYQFFSIPVLATVDFMVVQIGSISSLLLEVDNCGPIRDTIKLTVSVTGIKKNKNA